MSRRLEFSKVLIKIGLGGQLELLPCENRDGNVRFFMPPAGKPGKYKLSVNFSEEKLSISPALSLE